MFPTNIFNLKQVLFVTYMIKFNISDSSTIKLLHISYVTVYLAVFLILRKYM